MSEVKTSAIAVVTMTVSIELQQPWGADCTLAQVQKQARDGAETALGGLTRELHARGIRVGDVRAIRIVLNEERFP